MFFYCSDEISLDLGGNSPSALSPGRHVSKKESLSCLFCLPVLFALCKYSRHSSGFHTDTVPLWSAGGCQLSEVKSFYPYQDSENSTSTETDLLLVNSSQCQAPTSLFFILWLFHLGSAFVRTASISVPLGLPRALCQRDRFVMVYYIKFLCVCKHIVVCIIAKIKPRLYL